MGAVSDGILYLHVAMLTFDNNYVMVLGGKCLVKLHFLSKLVFCNEEYVGLFTKLHDSSWLYCLYLSLFSLEIEGHRKLWTFLLKR